jgi:3-methyladenine DNA glycosylase AlkC
MAELLKYAYDRAYMQSLAKALISAGAKLSVSSFCDAVFGEDWDELELKERMRKIRSTIFEQVNLPYKEATEILMIAGKDFGGFEGMLFPDYVQVYGLNSWVQSMKTLEVLTKFSSSEFAIRPFIEKDRQRAMKQMLKWSQHKNEHVRRLSSEGCRPRLPWAPALVELKKDPSDIIAILENLITDESLYVRKSVANNLNDISKDHPALAIKLAKKWIKNKNPETLWIVKHGLRTLLKK